MACNMDIAEHQLVAILVVVLLALRGVVEDADSETEVGSVIIDFVVNADWVLFCILDSRLVEIETLLAAAIVTFASFFFAAIIVKHSVPVQLTPDWAATIHEVMAAKKNEMQ